LFAVGENFLYVFKPGLTARTRRRDLSGLRSLPLRSARAPGGWRASRW